MFVHSPSPVLVNEHKNTPAASSGKAACPPALEQLPDSGVGVHDLARKAQAFQGKHKFGNPPKLLRWPLAAVSLADRVMAWGKMTRRTF